MTTDLGVFLTFGGMLILIYLFGKALLVPLKILAKLLLNSILGAILLVLINLACANFGICIPVNMLTAVTVGALGVPGTLMLLVFCTL